MVFLFIYQTKPVSSPAPAMHVQKGWMCSKQSKELHSLTQEQPCPNRPEVHLVETNTLQAPGRALSPMDQLSLLSPPALLTDPTHFPHFLYDTTHRIDENESSFFLLFYIQ